VDGVGEAGQLGVALLDDGESEDSKVGGDDAATDGLALALTSAAGAVAGVAVGEEQAHTGRVHDTLLHGEALLVVAAGDLEDVALELVANGVAGDFLTHAAVHEDTELALIFDLNELLGPVGRVGDVQLHLVGSTVLCPLGGSKVAWSRERSRVVGKFSFSNCLPSAAVGSRLCVETGWKGRDGPNGRSYRLVMPQAAIGSINQNVSAVGVGCE